MQKKFNVWVKKMDVDDFRVCSKLVRCVEDTNLLKFDKDEFSNWINSAANVCNCDVSEWLETLDMEEDEVRSFKLTFKEN